MRTLAGLLAMLLVLAGLGAPAEAGRSGFRSGGIHPFALSSKSMFGQVHPFTSHRIVFGNAVATRLFTLTPAPIFFNPGPVPQFTGTMAPTFNGSIVPPFTLGTPTNPNAVIIGNQFFLTSNGFLVSSNGFVVTNNGFLVSNNGFVFAVSSPTFVPGFTPALVDGRLTNFFTTGFFPTGFVGGGGRSVVLVAAPTPIAVPVPVQAAATPQIKAQIVVLNRSPAADKIRIFTPTAAQGGSSATTAQIAQVTAQ